MKSTRVGYSGGEKQNPSYTNIGDHTESIQIEYNPDEIAYEELLDIFWKNHQADRPVTSTQYKSIIFFHNEEQKKLAVETKKNIENSLGRKMYTDIRPFNNFYIAENYHQKYYLRMVRELMGEFEKKYINSKAFISSTVAARVNGYIKGCGTIAKLEEEIDSFNLSAKGKKRLFQIVEGYGK